MFWNGFFEGAYPGKVASKVYEIKEVSPNLLCSLSLGADSQCKKYQITQKISIQLILPPDEVIRNVESGSVAVEQRVRCEQWVRCKQWVRCALIHLLLEGIIKKRRRKTTRSEFTGEGTGIAPGRVLSQSPLPGCLQVHWWLSWHALSEQAPVRNFIN